jgi:UDP-glucose 4-epimerase
MRIGVTGASGFIGSYLTSALKNYGEVVALPRGKSLPSLAQLKSFVSEVELFFHLGGVNRGTDEEILTGNVTGTLRLLEAIKKHGEPSARILFASSSQVYRLKNRVAKISEASSLQPESIYGVSKKSAEDLIRISGLPFTILRLANVYGPGCRPEYNSVVATLCQRAKKKLPLKINGQGKQSRDFIYIDDVVRAFVLAGFSGKPLTGKAYNISSGQMTSLVKIVNAIKGFDKTVKVEFKPGGEDKISYCCDASRFKRDYGWKLKTSLSQGIEKSLKYFGKRK